MGMQMGICSPWLRVCHMSSAASRKAGFRGTAKRPRVMMILGLAKEAGQHYQADGGT